MSIVLRGTTLIDGRGGRPIPRANVLIEKDKIITVGEDGSFQIPSDAKVIELGGKWLLPGLIDAHCHTYFIHHLLETPRAEPEAYAALVAARTLHANLMAGVTTVRDVGVKNRISFSLRKAVNEGTIVGSRVFACGRMICQTGGHGSGKPESAREADGVADVRKAVREEWQAGADLIKVTTNGPRSVPEFSLEELQALVDEAHRLNLKVACHASIRAATRNAVTARVDTIEHGCDLDERLVTEMAEKGIILVPTLVVYAAMLKYWQDQGTIPEEMSSAAFERVATHRASVELALGAGVKIACGTDWVFPDRSHVAVVDELKLLVSCGLAPMQAIQSATQVAAEALGQSTYLGTIESGKLADIIAVDDDPTKDIGATSQVSLVIQGGKLVRHDTIENGPNASVNPR